MPLFDFHCDACGDVHEQLVRADWPPVPCSCGSTDLRRLQGPARARPNGIAAEVAPPEAPKPKKKLDGETTIDRVAKRITRSMPATPHAEARAIARATRLRKERRSNR